MTNIFNYRFKDITKALETVDKLKTKIQNNLNNSITLTYIEDKSYWNLKLSITNEQQKSNKTRIFNTVA